MHALMVARVGFWFRLLVLREGYGEFYEVSVPNLPLGLGFLMQ